MRPAYRLLSLAVAALAFYASAVTAETTHLLAPGETLYAVARRYGVPLELLKEVNAFEDPTRLAAGTAVLVPARHIVAPGETLYGIARLYAIPIDVLKAINRIDDPTTLRLGRALFLPATGAQSDSTLWPLDGPRQVMTGKLPGIVITGGQGEIVRSVSTGVVRWSGPYGIYGTVILVMNDLGYVFGYLGNEETFVAVGERVEIGTDLAKLAADTAGRGQLYFLVFKDGLPVDPGAVPRV